MLLCLGLNHRTTPVELRERLAQYQGSLDVSARKGEGFRLRASLPVTTHMMLASGPQGVN